MKMSDDLTIVEAQVCLVDSQCPSCKHVENHNSKEWPVNNLGAFISGVEYGVECKGCKTEYIFILPQDKTKSDQG